MPHWRQWIPGNDWRVRYHASDGDIKKLFGLNEKAKWPRRGMSPIFVFDNHIQPVKLWVDPITPGKFRIRCKAQCTRCHQVMAAGRYHQHVCKETGVGGWPGAQFLDVGRGTDLHD